MSHRSVVRALSEVRVGVDQQQVHRATGWCRACVTVQGRRGGHWSTVAGVRARVVQCSAADRVQATEREAS